MVTNFSFMLIMILMGLLIGAGHADVGPKHANKHFHRPWDCQTNYQGTNTDKRSNQAVPHNTPVFYDNDTLLAPNAHGEMTLYTIVDPTWELDIPGSSGREKINVMGTADKIIEYINTHFPDYVWPNIHDLNTTPPEKAAQDDPKPNCNVFSLGPYPMADLCQKTLKQIGSHYLNLGSGPGTCSQVECRDDLNGRQAAIWWCNDVSGSWAHVQLSFGLSLHVLILKTRAPTNRISPA